jgi:uncharacterized membrane protein YozB (DUF420 family)
MDRIENNTSNNSSIVACVFVAAVTFLPSRCLARKEGFMKYAVQICSRAMIYIYISSLIKIGSGVQKLIRGDLQAHRQQGDLISLFSLFQKKKK